MNTNQQLDVLQQYVDQAANQLAQQKTGPDETGDIGSLIYLGNIHDSFPRDLVTDPILNSGEIHTWMLMRLAVQDQQTITRIPQQDMLMASLKCSRPIVSRNLQILRAMRWITLCQTVRGQDGQYRGAVYVQHDTPLPLAETLMLDKSYLSFLQEDTKSEVFKRLIKIKQAVLKHTNYRLLADDNVLKPETRLTTLTNKMNQADDKHIENPADTTITFPLEVFEPNNEIDVYRNKRIPKDIQKVLNDDHHVKDFNTVESDKSDKPSHVKDFNMAENNHVKNFNMAESDKSDISDHVKNIDMVESKNGESKNQSLSEKKSHVKNINTANHVKVNTVYSSSCSYYNNTTTYNNRKKNGIRLPACLSWTDKTIRYTNLLIEQLPVDKRQYALDYVDDAYKLGEQGISTRVSNPIGYLKTIVSMIENDTLGPSSLGIRAPAKAEKTNSEPDQKTHIREIMGEIRHLEKMLQNEKLPQDTRENLEQQKAILNKKLVEVEHG